MCGIFYFETITKLSITQLKNLQEQFALSAHRGPDKSIFVNDTTRVFGFHRLSINGMDPASDQPFHLKNCRLICNGEIYNFRDLIKEFGLESEYKSGSDCEIIIHLYRKIGMKETLRRLDGVFGFVLYDYDDDVVFVARDPVGVRSLYIGVIRHDSGYGSEYSDILTASLNPDHYAMCISSEMKSMHSMCDSIYQFPAGCFMEYSSENNGDASFHSYYDYVSICDEESINNKQYCGHAPTGSSSNPNPNPNPNLKSCILEYKIETIKLSYSYPPLESTTAANDADFEEEICKNLR